jgi:hypothetical protein
MVSRLPHGLCTTGRSADSESRFLTLQVLWISISIMFGYRYWKDIARFGAPFLQFSYFLRELCLFVFV